MADVTSTLDVELIKAELKAILAKPPIRWGRYDAKVLIEQSIPALLAEVERLRSSVAAKDGSVATQIQVPKGQAVWVQWLNEDQQVIGAHMVLPRDADSYSTIAAEGALSSVAAKEPINSQNEQAWEDLRADGGLPETQVVAAPPQDVMESLHRVFTNNGIASYTDHPHLAGDVIRWACEMYRQSKPSLAAGALSAPAPPQEPTWREKFEKAVCVIVPLGCERQPQLSRICERGTPCCGIHHGKAAAPAPPALERLFPIQRVGMIPWSVAERAYERYAQLHGRSQSLERMAERGGFGLAELGFLLRGYGRRNDSKEDDRDWQFACEHATMEILKALADVARLQTPHEGELIAHARQWLVRETHLITTPHSAFIEEARLIIHRFLAAARPMCPTCGGNGFVMRSEHRDCGNGLSSGGLWNEPCPDCAPTLAPASPKDI